MRAALTRGYGPPVEATAEAHAIAGSGGRTGSVVVRMPPAP
ncbi:MAG: hypothetical protein ACOY5U_12710 [Pseudomonadota bacterium]